MKININWLLCLGILMMTLSCDYHKSLLPENIKCRCILSPTSAGHDTYLIEVSESGIIRTDFGWLPNAVLQLITQDTLIALCDTNLVEGIEKHGERKISEGSYSHLLELLDHSKGLKCDNPFVEGWADDAWLVVLMIETDQFVFLLGEEPNETIKLIVNELTSLSPIPFVEWPLTGGREKVELDLPDSLLD